MQLRGRKSQAASSLLGTSRVDRSEHNQKAPSRLQGLDAEVNIPSASGRGGIISLDIAFYRTALRLQGSQRLHFYDERVIRPIGTPLPRRWQGFFRVGRHSGAICQVYRADGVSLLINPNEVDLPKRPSKRARSPRRVLERVMVRSVLDSYGETAIACGFLCQTTCSTGPTRKTQDDVPVSATAPSIAKAQ